MSALFAGCSECDHGWRYVTEAYLDARFPMPPNATAEQAAAVWALREIYREQVFPCSECRPGAFSRWANGCLRSDHRAADCELCNEELGEKAAKRQDRAAARVGRRPEEEF